MPRRRVKASSQKARRLSRKLRLSQDGERANMSAEDQYVWGLAEEPDRKLTNAEILRVLKYVKADLDSAARKAGLR